MQAAWHSWGRRCAAVNPQHSVFLDECGPTTRLLRLFALVEGGRQAYDSAPYGHHQIFTVFGALRADGTTAVMTWEGAYDPDSFVAYLEEDLATSLGVGDVVVLDNLYSHIDPRVQARVEAACARMLYLPPYSTDLNPIEMLQSKLKAYIRKDCGCTEEELLHTLNEALVLVTSNDSKRWLQSCGFIPEIFYCCEVISSFTLQSG